MHSIISRMIYSGLWAFLLTQPAQALTTLVSIKPIYSLVLNISNGTTPPELLLEDRQSTHHFSLKPSQTKKIQQADLIIWVGPTLESPLNNIISDQKSKKIIQLINIPNLTFPAKNRQEHDDHDHAGHDPHIWLSVNNAIVIAHYISDKLINIDPANASIYKQNNKQLVDKLTQLKQELSKRLKNVKEIPYMVYHNAYSHFEQEYALTNIGSVTETGEHKKGARHLSKLHHSLETEHAVCIFDEPQFESRITQALADNHDINTATLDPLGVSLSPDKNAYFLLMENLANSLTTCLSNNDHVKQSN